MRDRPERVPPEAIYHPGGDNFDSVAAAHRNRLHRGALLRVAFPFAYGWGQGMLLRDVGPRALLVARGGGRRGAWLVFDTRKPLPGVWTWTLAEHRRALS